MSLVEFLRTTCIPIPDLGYSFSKRDDIRPLYSVEAFYPTSCVHLAAPEDQYEEYEQLTWGRW